MKKDDDVAVSDSELQIDAVSVLKNVMRKENSAVHDIFLHHRNSDEI